MSLQVCIILRRKTVLKVPLLPFKSATFGRQKCHFRNAKAALLKGVTRVLCFAESERFNREGYVRAVVKRVVAFDEGLGGLEVADVERVGGQLHGQQFL